MICIKRCESDLGALCRIGIKSVRLGCHICAVNEADHPDSDGLSS